MRHPKSRHPSPHPPPPLRMERIQQGFADEFDEDGHQHHAKKHGSARTVAEAGQYVAAAVVRAGQIDRAGGAGGGLPAQARPDGTPATDRFRRPRQRLNPPRSRLVLSGAGVHRQTIGNENFELMRLLVAVQNPGC